MGNLEFDVTWLAGDVLSDFELFVRSWQGQVGVAHLVFPREDGWVTVRVTRASLPGRLRDGPFWSSNGGSA